MGISDGSRLLDVNGRGALAYSDLPFVGPEVPFMLPSSCWVPSIQCDDNLNGHNSYEII